MSGEKTKHTPGPWHVVNHPKIVALRSERSIGAGVNGMRSVAWMTGGAPASEADARVIAAAPDLLASLKWLVGVCETEGRDCRKERELIARAEGSQS